MACGPGLSRCRRTAAFAVVWPQADPPTGVLAQLRDLARLVPYVGRSTSLAEVSVSTACPVISVAGSSMSRCSWAIREGPSRSGFPTPDTRRSCRPHTLMAAAPGRWRGQCRTRSGSSRPFPQTVSAMRIGRVQRGGPV